MMLIAFSRSGSGGTRADQGVRPTVTCLRFEHPLAADHGALDGDAD